MASYNFSCSKCGTLLEELMPMASATFDDRPCPVPSCGGICVYQVPGAPSVATSNMYNSPLDVVIGADSDKRWKKILERRDERNKVRRSAGERALHATGTGNKDFQALPGAKLKPVVIPVSAQEKF